eukprot:11566790-Alexandrium_andersonii.AAC.1
MKLTTIAPAWLTPFGDVANSVGALGFWGRRGALRLPECAGEVRLCAQILQGGALCPLCWGE